MIQHTKQCLFLMVVKVFFVFFFFFRLYGMIQNTQHSVGFDGEVLVETYCYN